MRFVIDSPDNNPDNNAEYLYRYDDGWSTVPVLRKFKIIKYTPCGYWVETPWYSGNGKKWVAKSGKNNYAKTTKDDAMENYYHRKRRHVSILKERLASAERRLRLAETETGRGKACLYGGDF